MVRGRRSQSSLYEGGGPFHGLHGTPEGPFHLVTLLFYPFGHPPDNLCFCLDTSTPSILIPLLQGTLLSVDYASFCQWTDFLGAGWAPS